ncbi:heterokaryon incompatibility protein-domain-containing protein [Staphylotrichum tortipilum]|uniref:Heterokaryon incompatibility protein-domain-containing protein n=1 Tax=Staphylotrichum tortipilum TaxID=2831512 RepID=A0AAN6RVM5_9PEZI|nr:heterokaryon incompatibility protein-domain-containing protein [Staphylotrichum longicolle]
MGEEASIPVGQKRQRPESPDADRPDPSPRKRTQKTAPDALCTSCALVFSRRGLEHLSSPNGFRHRTRAECTASGNAGCRLCKFILLVVSKENDENWASGDRLTFRNFRSAHSTSTVSGTQLPGIYGLKGTLESEPDKCIITIYPFAKKGSPIGDIVRRRPLHRDVRSGKVFAAAQSLIKECMSLEKPHQRCRYSRDTVLPTRVLDVGKPGDPHLALKLRVNETETNAPCLALSYCWGKQPKPTAPVQPVLLRRDTLQDLVGDIRLESLQQSIQDAVFVTRKLGFRYLWVDALCIIQDCNIDKDREISQMASIYKNAAITIAASCSENAKDGFLLKRTKPYRPNYEIPIPMPNGQRGTVYLSAEAYEPEHPLDKRGWTLQEFMLSSRMLMFSDYELLWQCKEVDLRSVTGRGLEYLQPLEALPWTVFDDDDEEPDFGNLDSDRLYLWKTIVQQYTERKLTDPGDRLRAIRGITTELEMLWRDSNIYGLWAKWFIQLLTWYKPQIDRKRKRCLGRAPSWSWASLDGVIRYEGTLWTEDAKVKSLTVSAAELTCRMLEEDEIIEEKSHTISERPDLVDPNAELRQNGLQERAAEYLLLGTVKGGDGVEKGIGLLVVDVGTRVYRRVGLVVFPFRKRKKFREWCGLGVIADHVAKEDVLEILGFLTSEWVQTLTDRALVAKRQEAKAAEAEAARRLAGVKRKRDDSGTFLMRNGGVVDMVMDSGGFCPADDPIPGTPIQPRHIGKAFDELQLPPKKYTAMVTGRRLRQLKRLRIF